MSLDILVGAFLGVSACVIVRKLAAARRENARRESEKSRTGKWAIGVAGPSFFTRNRSMGILLVAADTEEKAIARGTVYACTYWGIKVENAIAIQAGEVERPTPPEGPAWRGEKP